MTTTSAEVIEHSIGPMMQELITIRGVYPRWIHAEQRTHRLMPLGEEYPPEMVWPSIMADDSLSRNASSSRAIPVPRMIEAIRADPAVPRHWGSNVGGMQAGGECTNNVKRTLQVFVTDTAHPEGGTWTTRTMVETREEAWLADMEAAIDRAMAYDEAGYAKQIVNRILEPYSHIRVVITASNWGNFFALRDHRDAEPHIRDFAQACREAIKASVPNRLDIHQWHLPFVSMKERSRIASEDAVKVSAARCARVSYETHDGGAPTVEADLKLYDRLVGGSVIHASPLEHQATPDRTSIYSKHRTGGDVTWENPKLHGNLAGWVQARKKVAGEACG